MTCIIIFFLLCLIHNIYSQSLLSSVHPSDSFISSGNGTTCLASYKKCFFEENFEPLWIHIKVKPSSYNHSMSKVKKYCSQMQEQAEKDIFPQRSWLSKDNFVRVYREFKNRMMRGAHDILYDVIKKFRVVHESALYEYYRIHEPILHDRNHSAFLYKFNRTTNKHIVKEIRVLAYDIREEIYRGFDSMDDVFLHYYYNIPCDYNMYLNYSHNLDFYQINKSTAAKRRRIWRDYDGDHSQLK